MCGIVGYVGRDRDAQQVLVEGLRKLEYRGYDSAGVAIWGDDGLSVRRAVGKLVNLDGLLRDEPLKGRVGLGHTRWATHGKPSESNAHPHRAGSVAIVHNGIIENYRELRLELESAGREICSETDTELIAHLIDGEVAGGADLLTAVRAAARRLVGSYALGVLCESHPDTIVVAKNGGSPIILGVGAGESFLASDIPAILPYTRQMLFLEDGEFAALSREGVQITDADGRLVERPQRSITWRRLSPIARVRREPTLMLRSTSSKSSTTPGSPSPTSIWHRLRSMANAVERVIDSKIPCSRTSRPVTGSPLSHAPTVAEVCSSSSISARR